MNRSVAGAILSISLTSCGIAPAVDEAGTARIEQTKSAIREACAAIERYRSEQGTYPLSWRSLLTAPSGIDPGRFPSEGYLKAPPKDAWGNYLGLYSFNGRGPHGRPYEVASFGADALEGGQGEAADLWSYDVFHP